MPLNKLNKRRSIAKPTSSQSALQQYGIIAGTLAVLFFILFGFNILTRQSWERGLRHQTQLVLDRAFPGEYLVKDRVTLTPAIDMTGATFELFPKQGKPFEQRHLGMIIQVSTIFGPQPAVFLCEGGNAVRFAGFGFYSKTFAAENTVVADSQIPRLTGLISAALTTSSTSVKGGRN
jgi:hypothetical protein